MKSGVDDEEQLDAPPVPWMHGAAGICGGAFSMCIFYPLDLIRTRMHTYTGKEQSRLRGAIETARADGLRAMFRGVKIAVIAHSFGWGMYLTVFRTLQQAIARSNNGDSSLGDFVSACGAAGVTSAVVTPLNFLKTNIQLSSSEKNGSSVSAWSILRRTVKERGVSALMRGLGPQFLLSSHTTIQVALYECIKRYWWGGGSRSSSSGSTSSSETAAYDKKGGGGSGDGSRCSSNNDTHQQQQGTNNNSSSGAVPWQGVALASAVSKGFASAICNPLEVCRTRLQDSRNANSIEYSSMGAAFRTIWRTEGVRGLYRGLTVNVCRVVPSTVVAFITYESILQLMHNSSKSALANKNKK